MATATREAAARACPGPAGLAALFVASVPVPLWLAVASGPVESFPSNWAVYWWIVDWPRAVILLLGATPGLLIIFDTARRRVRHRRAA